MRNSTSLPTHLPLIIVIGAILGLIFLKYSFYIVYAIRSCFKLFWSKLIYEKMHNKSHLHNNHLNTYLQFYIVTIYLLYKILCVLQRIIKHKIPISLYTVYS